MSLKEIRRQKGLSQKEIGDLLKISQPQVSKYELEKDLLNVKQIRILCDFLKVSSDELIGIKQQAKDIKAKYQTKLTEEEIIEVKKILEINSKYYQRLALDEDEE